MSFVYFLKYVICVVYIKVLDYFFLQSSTDNFIGNNNRSQTNKSPVSSTIKSMTTGGPNRKSTFAVSDLNSKDSSGMNYTHYIFVAANPRSGD